MLIKVFRCTVLVLMVLSASVAYAEQNKESSEIESSSKFSSRNPEDYLNQFQHAGQIFNVPVPLMLGIAEGESGFHPWAINIEGKGFYPRTKEKALQMLSTCQGKSFDVGLMQINVFWLKKFNIRVEDAIEPSINILFAAYIINENFESYGLTWQSIGAYHTPPHRNPERAKAYVLKVSPRFMKYILTE